MDATADTTGDIDLQRWVGRLKTEQDTPTAQRVAALAATLDDAASCSSGDELPPAWHWILFHKTCPTAQLDSDGHPPRGAFLPPISLARRMWAGGTLRWHRPLHIDERVERRSEITSITSKIGRSGSLVFVVVLHRLIGESGLAIEERQDIVYRGPAVGTETSSLHTTEPESRSSVWRRTVHPDPALLFRYSALTFNSHRIHYDRDYAMRNEGYPGLVVHGPLVATFMLQLIRAASPNARLALFSYRAASPLFDTGEFRVCGRPANNQQSAEIWAETPQGRLAVTAQAEFLKH